MEEKPKLDALLEGLQADGSAEGSGVFSLDPRRALELLRQQGSIGENAPLFLLRALYELTQGAGVAWKRSLFNYQLRWDEQYGEISPSDTYRLLAEGAFEAASITLTFGTGVVTLSNGDALSAPFAVRFGDTFEAAQPRLRRYPVEGLFPSEEPSEPWLSSGGSGSRLEIRHPEGEPVLEWVVCGVSFFEKSPIPVSVTVLDDDVPCDLSLTRVVSSERRQTWLTRATELFDRMLEQKLGDTDVLLDHQDSVGEAQEVLSFLPYLLSLSEGSELREKTLRLVKFKDVFEHHWSIAELLQSEREYGKILVVSSRPEDCPASAQGSRPVLLWSGESKRYGNPIFKRLQSGAGYLYSLRRGEQMQERGAESEVLAETEWSQGTLALKGFGLPESRFEMELQGRRRGSETVHLDPPAPTELRLLWVSPQEVVRWDDGLIKDDEFKQKIVTLVDAALSEQVRSSTWLHNLLAWADSVTDLAPFESLRQSPLFASVDGSWVSFEELSEPVRVVQDRSASIPDELPYPVVLWSDPMLSRFGLETKDAGAELRAAYWKQDGRKRWLNRFEAKSPEDWDEVADLPGERLEDGHWRFPIQGEGRLVIWREGRPLGRRFVGQPGWLFIYVDDNFPADPYWSGPDSKAVSEVIEWCKGQE